MLNYKIELGVAGYIDNRNYVATPAQKLILLADQIRYWKEMTWTQRISYQTPGLSYKTDTRYCRGLVIRPIVPVEFENCKFEIVQLRQSLSEREQPPPHIFALRYPIAVLSFDPGQDLLVAFARQQ